MQKTYSNPGQINALKLRAAAIQKGVETINTALSIAIAIVENWDGKDLSRRLTTAIQKEIDAKMGEKKVGVSMSYEGYSDNEINFYLYERGYKDAPNYDGYSCTSYIDNELHARCPFPKSMKVEAEKIVASMKARVLWNKQVAYKYNDAVKNFVKYIAKYEKALYTFQSVCGEINPLFVDSQVSTWRGYYPKSSPWEEKRDNEIGQ